MYLCCYFFVDFFKICVDLKTLSINWLPWLVVLEDNLYIQFFIIWLFVYVYLYSNTYYTLLYTFLCFFFFGIVLSIFQVEFFSAFLWLIECSVVFVYLLLLFFINVKGIFDNAKKQHYNTYFFTFIFFFLLTITNLLFQQQLTFGLDVNFLHLFDNYYESVFNFIQNDLFGFVISYYFLNIIEFLIIGLLLLVGSILCVNLFQFNKRVRIQSYKNYMNVFNFYKDFSSFFFLRKQNLIKQGNTKTTLKTYKK